MKGKKNKTVAPKGLQQNRGGVKTKMRQSPKGELTKGRKAKFMKKGKTLYGQ